ncbi:DNA topoisomerase [Peptoniphilus indolicus]|uniref:DNA topoisomerase n=2 Tax=Peptoniphilus indolicus TaxID=33030 RepID=G4D544_9FIRM|nr:DNA topoisomerase [Peptoniphilus indolicus]EGY79345.1 DNA topoisomerase TopB [Peptoniphilus indolicus ATCC 29427]SUB76318.1 DNA topoisomerase 3 [Peptoniphilus indolicus]
MGKSLILAEKPSVARDIARVLNVKGNRKGYLESDERIVTWALGHLVTLATPEEYNKTYEKWRAEDLPIIPEHMKLKVIQSSKAQFNIVKELINRKDVSEIVIATDAGREGELVARLILKMSGNRKPLKRLWISSVTDKAIKEGFKNLKSGDDYLNLYSSADARSQADWIVGINASRALTVKHNASLSCGRVQTPTLNLIKLREDEINNFKQEEYYSLSIMAGGVEFKPVKNVNYKDKSEIEDLKNKFDRSIEVIDTDTKVKKKYPSQLYDLTNLQKDANAKFGYSAKETLNLMQTLYERHKVLTYPRTDSRYLTEDIVPTLEDRLSAINIKNYREDIREIRKNGIKASNRFVDDKKVSDHHAIIPTEEPLRIEELSDKEFKIFDLVAKRFIENLLPPEEYYETTVTAKAGDIELRAKVDEYKISDKKIIIDELKVNTHHNRQPEYYNEGTLLLAMENPTSHIKDLSGKETKILKSTGGIGTVATRGDIIEKLYSADLIENVDGKIKITSKGRQLLEIVPDKLKSPKMTADWEQKLLSIEKGELKAEEFLKEIKNYSKESVGEILTSDKQYRHQNLTSTKCDVCGKSMLRVNRKEKEMLVCQDPNCSGRKVISVMTKSRCPNCHKRLKLLMGSGQYVCETCGYRTSKEAMEKKFKEKANQPKKGEVKKFLNKQEDTSINNTLGNLLKGLKLDE